MEFIPVSGHQCNIGTGMGEHFSSRFSDALSGSANEGVEMIHTIQFDANLTKCLTLSLEHTSSTLGVISSEKVIFLDILNNIGHP